jgi:hypothetical protein
VAEQSTGDQDFGESNPPAPFDFQIWLKI